MERYFEFFELLTPKDLFQKIEEDLTQLEKSNDDPKIAFNFFVSVEHLPDWLGLRKLVRENCILRIVSHIANGAKHFNLRDKRHKSVLKAEKSRYVEKGYFEEGYVEEPLVIYLSEDETKEIGSSEIDAVKLAREVVEFWRPYVEKA